MISVADLRAGSGSNLIGGGKSPPETNPLLPSTPFPSLEDLSSPTTSIWIARLSAWMFKMWYSWLYCEIQSDQLDRYVFEWNKDN